jgi:hypothetical protein
VIVSRRLVLSFAVGAMLIASAPAARAEQQDALRTARAEKLFDDAKRLLEQGHVKEACAAFADSRRLDPQVGTLLNLALCHEREGKIASAWAEYNGVVEGATRAAQPKRAEFAKARARALEPRLARVTFVVDRASLANLRMTIDGETVDASLLDGTPVPIDSGSHTAVVSADGKQPATFTFTVPENPSVTSVQIPVLRAAPVAAQPSPKNGATDPPKRSGIPLSTWGWGATGVGAAAIVAGGVFGGLALSKKSDADEACPTERCLTRDGYEASEAASTHATISTVLVAAGAALVAGGVTLVLLAPRSRAAATTNGLVVRF